MTNTRPRGLRIWYIYLYKFELDHCMVRRKSMYLRTCGRFKSVIKKKYWVRKSKKVPHLQTVWRVYESNKLFKSAYLRICYMWNLFADCPPLLKSKKMLIHNFRHLQKETFRPMKYAQQYCTIARG